MLRKKLIALWLIGIITFGTIISNTVITIATSTKAEASYKAEKIIESIETQLDNLSILIKEKILINHY